MQWSKLRSAFLEHVAEELRGRIDVHSAAYKSGGRTWVSFDGIEIACVHAPGFTRQVFGHATCADLHHGQTLELGDALYQLVHSSIDACLSSENPLLQSVAMLDRRFGKRRIEALLQASADAIPSFQAALLSARLVAGKKPPIMVNCEHCGQVLFPPWSDIAGNEAVEISNAKHLPPA